MKMVLEANKNIGKVLYVTEGKSPEFEIISAIFINVLNYEEVNLYGKTPGCRLFVNKSNPYSQVFVVKSNRTDIKGINLNDDYFDDLHKMLVEDFGFDVDNMAVYFIFDRDRGSNKPKDICSSINKYTNSRNNNKEMNGLLLLSYPSVESFFIQAGNKEEEFVDASNAKLWCAGEGLSNCSLINETSIQTATEFMINKIESIISNKFQIDYVDNFKDVNSGLFKYEENHFLNKHTYISLTLLTISLIDLGIIDVIN